MTGKDSGAASFQPTTGLMYFPHVNSLAMAPLPRGLTPEAVSRYARTIHLTDNWSFSENEIEHRHVVLPFQEPVPQVKCALLFWLLASDWQLWKSECLMQSIITAVGPVRWNLLQNRSPQ